MPDFSSLSIPQENDGTKSPKLWTISETGSPSSSRKGIPPRHERGLSSDSLSSTEGGLPPKSSRHPLSRSDSGGRVQTAAATPPRHVRNKSAPKSAAFLNDRMASHYRNLSSSSSSSLGSGLFDDEEILHELNESLRSRIYTLGEAHPKVAHTYNKIGNFHFRRGEFDAAADSYSDALRCYNLIRAANKREQNGESYAPYVTEDQLAIAVTLVNIGTLCWRTGRLDEAVSCLQEALNIQVDVYSKTQEASEMTNERIQLSGTLYNLGIAQSLRGDYDAAMHSLSRALRARETAYGSVHIEVARTLDAMGKVHLLKGEKNDAMKCHKDSLIIRRSLLGNRHPGVLFSMMNVGVVHKERGELAEAAAVFREVARFRSDAVDNAHDSGCEYTAKTELGDALYHLGQVSLELGDLHQAKKELTEAQNYLKSAGLSDDDSRLVSLMKLMEQL